MQDQVPLSSQDALYPDKSLGEVQAERFISLILREPFDYTVWQRKLWTNENIEDISGMAMDYQTKNNNPS